MSFPRKMSAAVILWKEALIVKRSKKPVCTRFAYPDRIFMKARPLSALYLSMDSQTNLPLDTVYPKSG